ncbi:MAG: FAD-dependent oxidoreductase [Firmicutes bacterium]|nr:FAD-dependent oxidoreductase [Bacillota bacterium]
MRSTALIMSLLLLVSLAACSGGAEEEPYTADVVIIGAGGAGLVAAIEAAEQGADVIIVEKMSFAGGSTLRTGRLGGRGSQLHEEAGAGHTVEEFIDLVYKGGQEQGSLEHIRVIAENIGDALDWYVEMGYDMYINPDSPDRPEHASGSNHGAELISVLMDKVEELNVEILFNTKATELVMDEGRVVGVKAVSDVDTILIDAKSVILATGEFGANAEMIEKYAPQWAGLQTSLMPPSSSGDGHKMAKEVGAKLVGMEWMVVRHGYLPGGVRVDGPDGGIYVNSESERFVNESASREELSSAILAQPDGFAWWVLPLDEAENIGRLNAQIGQSEHVFVADTISELAAKTDLSPESLEKILDELTVAPYGRDADAFADFSVGPYVAAKVIPGSYTTMGGVDTDLDSRVLDTTGQPIPGLYAAGGVTGMIGDGRSAGANHAQLAVFGRIAGRTAVADIK